MRVLATLAPAMAIAAATVFVAATAHAGGPPNNGGGGTGTGATGSTIASYQFQTPDGNIACSMGPSTTDGLSFAGCEIGNHTYVAPPTPPNCHLAYGDRFTLVQGSPPVLDCHGDTIRVPGLATLPYGQTRSSGPITCDSEATGVTCTDSSTGHFFRVSPDSYQLG